MVQVPARYTEKDDWLDAVVQRINHAPHIQKAERWHSGGGITGVLVTFPNGDTLFSQLQADHNPAWAQWDWIDRDGELVATLEVQARPWPLPDPNPPQVMDDPNGWSATDPEAFVAAHLPVFERIR